MLSIPYSRGQTKLAPIESRVDGSKLVESNQPFYQTGQGRSMVERVKRYNYIVTSLKIVYVETRPALQNKPGRASLLP